MSNVDKLTMRQKEILHLVAQGQHNKGIAKRLGISAYTVAQHLKAIYAVLAVSTRVDAARMYMETMNSVLPPLEPPIPVPDRLHHKGQMAYDLLSLLMEDEETHP